MAKQQSCHKFIYKLHSKRLKDSDWNLTLPLSEAIRNEGDIVALNDSQILRWILEYRNITDLDQRVSEVKNRIRHLKKLPVNKSIKKQIKLAYSELYELQYQPDYLCIIMDSDKDYDRCNEGFSINGIEYKRLLGTNNGIKKSTIVYVSAEIHDFIMNRITNGRDVNQKLLPAKLEAYQALVCSGSIVIPTPKIVVVNDVNVNFSEDVITIADGNTSEPELNYVYDYEINYCESDGYGLMSPDYSRTVNQVLYGDGNETISGINVRYAWTKGMVFTFDYVEYAKQKNNECYMIQDAWGEWRDVRDYDVILTTSQLKLWDAYKSLEDYVENCNANHYEFGVAKTTPHQLENVRNSNYQFLQTYKLTDEQIYELCKPTIDEIQCVLGDDWRRTITFLKGFNMTESEVQYVDDDYIKAIMIDPNMVNDPFIMSKIHKLIKKRITDAAKGSIKLHGNFSIISGDLYSLAQSIFGHKPTGLLKAGEVYSKYWLNQSANKIACFRAPMTCHNNIRVRNVVTNADMDYWYQYNTTGLILNSWDSTCDATNGSDKDGDMFFTTDNQILIENTRPTPTIECMQKKGTKIVPDEASIIQATKLAFGDEIGTTTNHITSMIDVQAQFDPDSEEYKTLEYRIMCGQHLQQASIDKAKGIISKPMPKYWYNKSACIHTFSYENGYEEDEKEFQLRIIADRKPYFMTYIYPELATKYKKYIKDSNNKCKRQFHLTIDELYLKEDKTQEELDFLKYYEMFYPVGNHNCTINRIAWLIEKEFKEYLSSRRKFSDFDYSILKSGVEYNKATYNQIAEIKKDYDRDVANFKKTSLEKRYDKDEVASGNKLFLLKYKSLCEQACPNEYELCDILLDMCYKTQKSKQFVWDLCSKTIIENLLVRNNNELHIPIHVDSDGEFEFCGEQFNITTVQIK